MKKLIAIALIIGGLVAMPDGLDLKTITAWAEGEGKLTPQQRIEMELVEELKAKQEELARREEEMQRREERVSALESDMDKKIDEMKRLELRIEELVKMRNDLEDEQVATLSKAYSTMSSDEAAERLKTMDRPIAVRILGGMKAKSSARILSSMDVNTATIFTELLAKRKIR